MDHVGAVVLMAKFNDEHGREWIVRVSLRTVQRVRADADVDLLGAMDGETFLHLANDPEKMMHVLWVVVEDQARERDVTPEAFAELLLGDVLRNATTAFVEAVSDFFACPAQREALREAQAKANEVTTKAAELATKKIQSIDANQMAEQIAGESAETTPSA